jgi:MFS family permease
LYQFELFKNLRRSRRAAGATGRRARVSRTVLLLGLTSMFTDISSEMVAAILPLYLVFGVGLSPVQFGVVDGLYQGITAPARLLSGVLGDRWRRHKEVATAGYGLSTLTRLAMPLAGSSVPALTGVVMADRVGKGIRTAPRDAMISLSSTPESLATSFSVHRALDTLGALLGPLVAFGILALAPRGYDAVFVASFCFGLIGVAILWLFVDNRHGAPPPPPPAQTAADAFEHADPAWERPTLREAAALLGRRRFRTLVAIGGGLALVTVSDGFVYLLLQRRVDFDETLLPLLYIGTALAYMLLAVPTGHLADRIGRARVFLGGYVMLLLVYIVLLAPDAGLVQVLLCLALFGAYYAATDGVLMALASTLVPRNLLGTGLALLVTATSLGRLVSAVAFGALWTWSAPETAIAAFAAGLVVAVLLAAVAFVRTRGDAGGGPVAA